jgi:hypothetical protein
MKWTLFARLDGTVNRARRLDPVADCPALAATLLDHNPRVAEGSSDAAMLMARHALGLLSRLPKDIDEAAASIVDPNPLAPGDALARVAALAYVALCKDLLPNDLPGGGGLVDDAISLRATGVGAANVWDQDARARQLERLGLEARFLSLFLPRARLPEFNHALAGLFWTVSAYTRVSLAELKQTTRRLIEQPPQTLAELLPEHDGLDQTPRPELFELCDASVEHDGQRLRFAFDDAIVIDLAGEQLSRGPRA